MDHMEFLRVPKNFFAIMALLTSVLLVTTVVAHTLRPDSPTTVSRSAVATTLPAAYLAPEPQAPSGPQTSEPQTPDDTSTSDKRSMAENLALILDNPSRNTDFDNNQYSDVASVDIPVDALSAPGDAYSEPDIANDPDGLFRVKCEVSHFAYDDPIVFPGQPGNGHLHMFFGNTEANAYSTFDSLMNTGTGTCSGEDLNRTAYWIPAVLDEEGNALIPWEVMVYYKNTNFALNGANNIVEPFPDNLRMIAGNGRAETPQTELTGPGSAPVVGFGCGRAYFADMQPTIPNCYGDDSIEMKIAFPACWAPDKGTYQKDGSHVTNPESGYYQKDCPSSHPVALPSVMYRIFFRASDFGGSLENLHLSSDVRNGELLPGGTTLHADWFGAWHAEAMDSWVNNCTNKQNVDCEIGLLQRNPDISMTPRKTGFYPRGHRVPVEDLAALCPEESFDASNPVISISHCGHK